MGQVTRAFARRWVVGALALVAVLGVVQVVVPMAGTGAAADDAVSALAVEVPFGGAGTGPLPEGWVVTECPRGEPPRLVVVTCEDGVVTFTALGYEPEQEPQAVTVAATLHGAEQTLTYTVSLAAPALEGPRGGLFGYPLGQGVGVTIPFSELVALCEGCTETGPTYGHARVEPAEAGTAAFTASGLALAPAPGFTGEASVTFQVQDPYGRVAEAVPLQVRVVPGTSHAPLTVPHMAWVEVGESASGNVLVDDLVEEGYPSVLASCGQPLNGDVTCDADGAFVYTPRDGFAGIDQFAYHLSTERTGDHAVGSVVIGVGTDPSAALDVRERTEMTSPLTPAQPLSPREQTRAAGVFPALRDAFEEIQAQGENGPDGSGGRDQKDEEAGEQ